jgi:hypothetical protein
VLRILDDLRHLLYPKGSGVPTDNAEGKMLMRILFSSIADTFETFMSDLLYEVYLAKPETLKSDAPVTVKEVLDCADSRRKTFYEGKTEGSMCLSLVGSRLYEYHEQKMT